MRLMEAEEGPSIIRSGIQIRLVENRVLRKTGAYLAPLNLKVAATKCLLLVKSYGHLRVMNKGQVE